MTVEEALKIGKYGCDHSAPDCNCDFYASEILATAYLEAQARIKEFESLIAKTIDLCKHDAYGAVRRTLEEALVLTQKSFQCSCGVPDHKNYTDCYEAQRQFIPKEAERKC